MSLIDIQPDVLEYKYPFTVQSTEYARITNHSEERIAFKVKTTAPKFYCVRPNAALVAPGETVQIQVILLGLTEEPDVDFKCRDKFLVLTLPAPYDLGEKSVGEAWPELEAEFKQQAVSKKIKVKYVHPVESQEEKHTSPSSPLPQGEETVVETTAVEEEEPVVKQEREVEKPVEKPAEKLAEKASPPTLEKAKDAPIKEQLTEESSINANILVFLALIVLVLGWLYY